MEVVGEDPESGPGLGTAQSAKAGATKAETALEEADTGFDPDSPVTHLSDRAAAFVLSAGLSRVPLRWRPIRRTPSSAIVRSLTAVPNPRSATTVVGTRPTNAVTRSIEGTSCGASAGLPRWTWRSATNPFLTG